MYSFFRVWLIRLKVIFLALLAGAIVQGLVYVTLLVVEPYLIKIDVFNLIRKMDSVTLYYMENRISAVVGFATALYLIHHMLRNGLEDVFTIRNKEPATTYPDNPRPETPSN